MILTTHALAGAAIGKTFDNPWAIIALSVIIHFFLDTFRHGEYLNRKSGIKEVLRKVLIDLSAGIGAVLFITLAAKDMALEKIYHIFLGSFFSMFPDLLTFLYWKLNITSLKKIFEFHGRIHKHPQGSKERAWTFRNSMNDIIFSIIAIAILLF